MGNPIINEKIFSKEGGIENYIFMTLDGTINKTIILLLLTISSAIYVWIYPEMFLPFILPIIVLSFILAIIIIIFKKSSVYLSQIYAILEGISIGVLSLYYESDLPGIIIQAVSLTFLVFIIMLFLYKTRIIEATDNFKSCVFVATLSIALIYGISFLGYVSGYFNVPYIHESGYIGIIFSCFVVGIASLNLILDFDNISVGVAIKAPKYMEWYCGFGLLITLVWLYLEILRLLVKVRRK